MTPVVSKAAAFRPPRRPFLLEQPPRNPAIWRSQRKARLDISVQLLYERSATARPGGSERGSEHGGRQGELNPQSGCVSLHSVLDPLLFRQLPRPRERRVRQADHGRGPPPL